MGGGRSAQTKVVLVMTQPRTTKDIVERNGNERGEIF